MSLKINSKKVIASVMALTIVASGVLATDTSLLGKIVQTNIISASAANTITYGDWEYEEINSATAKLTKYNGSNEYVMIPEAIDGHTVTELERRLFQNNTTITSVAIPRGITQIPNSCFNGATNLTSVAIPQGVNKIDYMAFANTPSLEAVYLSTTFDEIGELAFYNSGISNISIPSANVIGCNAFEDCKNLKSIKLPNNLKSVYIGAFSGCTNLETVTFPETLTCIGSESFENCESLKSVILPNNLDTLNPEAFKGCTSLESISIPASVTWLAGEAFANCTSLKTATINSYPDEMLGGSLFKNCTALENINYPNDDKRFIHEIIYGEMVAGCPNFKKVNNENIVTYESHRYNPYSKPVMKKDFMEEVMKDFSYVDEKRLAFFEEYLEGTIKYIAGTNTHIIGSSTVFTTVQKVKLLHDWVCNNVNYAYLNGEPDPSKECHVDSSVFMRDTTVCDGYARALALLLRAEGIEAYYVQNPGVHAWCIVKIGDYYFHVDPCHDDCGAGITYDHFLVSDKDIKECDKSHSTWEIATPSNSRIDYSITSTPTCEYSIGDANMDGKIDKQDLQLVRDYLSNTVTFDPSDPFFLFADVNFNGKIDCDDAYTIDSWIAPIV